MAQCSKNRIVTESNSKECIIVSFVNKDIDPLTFFTHFNEHQNSVLTCQYVLQECIRHCQQFVCEKGSDYGGLKFLPVFGLVVLPEEQLWLPENYKFERSSDKKSCYKFKVRFRPPVGYQCNEDSNNFMWEYMFLQIYEDFLLGDLGSSEKLNDKNIFQLISWALLMPKTLPFKSSLVVDEEYKERQVRFWNFRSTFSKAIRSRLITTCCIDHYWIAYTLKESLKIIKGTKHKLGIYKQKFYQLLVEAEPNYCSEYYEVLLVENSDKVTVTVNYFGENHQPALFYGEELQCILTDIFDLKLALPKNLNAKSWEVTMLLKNDDMPRRLQFTEELAAKSFISMVQGFFSLYVRYDVCLNKDIQTSESQIRSDLQSFGPLSNETAEKYLKEPQSPGVSKLKRYLVHESLREYGCFVVVARTNRTTRPSHNIIFERYLLTTRDRIFILTSESYEDVQTFQSSKELRNYLKQEFGIQEHPRYYQIISEIDVVYKSGSAQVYYPEDKDISTLSSDPGVYLREELERRRVIRDKNPQVLKFEVSLKGEKMMLVELQSDDGKIAKGFREGIQDLFKLYKKKPDNFLKFYGTVWEGKLCVLMEYTPHFDLLTYICENPQTVRQKMKIIQHILKILSVMEEHKLYHGNIRLRRFLVFKNDGNNTPQIKLGDSGIASYLNYKSQDDLDNIERLPWLSPERRDNLKNITYESECYSVGTALCEIIYRSDQFHVELNLGDIKKLVQYYQHNPFLPKPDSMKAHRSPNHNTSDCLSCKSDAVLEEVWDNIIMKCWTPEIMERPSTRELFTIFSYINAKAEDLDREEVTEGLKQMVYDVGLKEEIPKIGKAHVTKKDLVSILMENLGDKFLKEDCLDMSKSKQLGQGFFGVVWDGLIRSPYRNLYQKGNQTEWRKVAIKRFLLKQGQVKKEVKVQIESNLTKEVLIACTLNHPNIVKVLHFAFDHKESQYSNVMLIMEFMNERDLSKYSKKHEDLYDLNVEGNLLKICLDVAEGMVYLSGKEIVHRDLAARNILLARQSNGQIIGKVSDFGLARNMEENYKFYRNKANNALPVAWMPPECLDQSSEDTRFTSKGDVWSFGTVVWEAFALGKSPKDFLPNDVDMKTADCHQVLFNKYKNGWRLQVDSHVSKDVHKFMMDCWVLDPSKRPFFVELVQHLKKIIDRNALNRTIFQNFSVKDFKV